VFQSAVTVCDLQAQRAVWTVDFRGKLLDLDNNCQSPDGYFGNGMCTPTGMM